MWGWDGGARCCHRLNRILDSSRGLWNWIGIYLCSCICICICIFGVFAVVHHLTSARLQYNHSLSRAKLQLLLRLQQLRLSVAVHLDSGHQSPTKRDLDPSPSPWCSSTSPNPGRISQDVRSHATQEVVALDKPPNSPSKTPLRPPTKPPNSPTRRKRPNRVKRKKQRDRRWI